MCFGACAEVVTRKCFCGCPVCARGGVLQAVSPSAAPPARPRHVPRLQRRLRPPHHHLLARGPPLPSRWVSGPGDAAAELPRHGPGLPTPPPLPAERGYSRLGRPLPSLAAFGEGGGETWRLPGLASLGSRPAWSCGVRGEAWREPGAAAIPGVAAWERDPLTR